MLKFPKCQKEIFKKLEDSKPRIIKTIEKKNMTIVTTHKRDV